MVFPVPGSALASPASLSVPPGFPCFPSSSQYSALCSFPFALPCFASHSRSTGASLTLSPSGFSASHLLPFVRLRSASSYSASVSSFPFFPAPPHSGFHSSRFRSRFLALHHPSRLVSHALLPASRTRLSVCFLSLFPASLPTAVPQVLPLRSRLRAFPLPSRLLSSTSVPLPATQPLLLPFRSSRLRLTVASPVHRLRSHFLGFPRSSQPGFPCLLPRFSYSASCLFPFVPPGFAPTAVPPVLPFFSASSRPLLFRAFPLPAAFFRSLPLGSDYSAFRSFLSLLPGLP